MTGPRRRPGAGTSVPILIVLAGLLTWAGWYAAFTSLEYFDDEGDWLVELKMFYEHGSLYHQTWSQAGPFYYDFWAAVFGVLHAPITMDTGRLAGLGTWAGVSLAAGLLVWANSGRLSTAIVAQIGTFLAMEGLSAEPLEPAGIASLFIVLALIAATWWRPRRPRAAMYAVGALVAAAVFSKVNLGLFLAAGVVAAGLLAGARPRWATVRYALALIIFVGLPLALCASLISRTDVGNFVGVVIAGGAVLVITAARAPLAALGQPSESLGWGDAGRAGAGAGAVLAVVVAVALATGTTVGQLLQGALLSQRDLANVYSAPPPVLVSDIPIAIFSVAAAIAAGWPAVRSQLPLSIPLRAAVRAVVGLFMVLTCVGGLLAHPTYHNLTHMQVLLDLAKGEQFYAGPLTWGTCLYAVPLGWLAARKPGADGTSYLCLSRALIVSVATLLALEAYPVSGHQMSWSTLGLVVVGALLIDDALTLAALAPQGQRWGMPAQAATAVISVGLVAANMAGFAANYATLYHRNVSTGFATASLVRWPAPVVQAYQAVAQLLVAHCSTYYSLPGLNSFYFLTGEPPPSGLDTTQWMYLMDRPDQEQVVAALRRTPRLCVLYDTPPLFFWEQWKPLPDSSPLLQYMQDNFAPVAKHDCFVVLVRTAAGHTPAPAKKEWVARWRSPVGPLGTCMAPYFT